MFGLGAYPGVARGGNTPITGELYRIDAKGLERLDRLEDYQLNVRFDWGKAADLLLDEPPPLGKASGPNASRMLAAAAANCLSSSLLFCLAKDMFEDFSIVGASIRDGIPLSVSVQDEAGQVLHSG